jgi:hypothetical protein
VLFVVETWKLVSSFQPVEKLAVHLKVVLEDLCGLFQNEGKPKLIEYETWDQLQTI